MFWKMNYLKLFIWLQKKEKKYKMYIHDFFQNNILNAFCFSIWIFYADLNLLNFSDQDREDSQKKA